MRLSDHLFWDVKLNSISWETHKAFVIKRVFERGTLSDFRKLVDHYGIETCKDVMINSRSLSKKTHAFCSLYFRVEKEKFRCFSDRRFHQKHWNY